MARTTSSGTDQHEEPWTTAGMQASGCILFAAAVGSMFLLAVLQGIGSGQSYREVMYAALPWVIATVSAALAGSTLLAWRHTGPTLAVAFGMVALVSVAAATSDIVPQHFPWDPLGDALVLTYWLLAGGLLMAFLLSTSAKLPDSPGRWPVAATAAVAAAGIISSYFLSWYSPAVAGLPPMGPQELRLGPVWVVLASLATAAMLTRGQWPALAAACLGGVVGAAAAIGHLARAATYRAPGRRFQDGGLAWEDAYQVGAGPAMLGLALFAIGATLVLTFLAGPSAEGAVLRDDGTDNAPEEE